MKMPFPLFRRHGLWRADLDAYVDGGLPPGRAAAVERHLEHCKDCAGLVAERRQLKLMAGSLPLLPAPRSFRITPGMLVDAAPVAAAGARAWMVRAAQLTAGLAVVAFAAVLTLDLSSGSTGSSPANFDAREAGDDADSAGANDSLAQPGKAASGLADAATPTPAIPGFLGENTGGQSYQPTRVGTPPPPATGRGPEVGPTLAGEQGERSAVGSPTTPEPASQPGTLAADDDDADGSAAWRIAEAGLGLLVIASVATWLLLRRSSAGRGP